MYIIQGSKLKSSQKALIFLEKYLFKKKGGVYKILRRELYKFGKCDVGKRCFTAGKTENGSKWKETIQKKKALVQ